MAHKMFYSKKGWDMMCDLQAFPMRAPATDCYKVQLLL